MILFCTSAYIDNCQGVKAFNEHVKKVLITLSIILGFFIMSPTIWAATYYVDATNGNNNNDGLSPFTAWKTIGKVNSYANSPCFADGDTIRFKRGSVFNDATLQSPRANNITLEDYGTGNKPLFDGDVHRPVYIVDSFIRNLTIRNIDISGMDFNNAIDINLFIRYVNGITIDGVDSDGHRKGNSPGQLGGIAIELLQTSGETIIKNCNLYNWGTDPILSGTEDSGGILISELASGKVYIHNNTIHDVTADCIALKKSTANISVYSNTLFNHGEQAIDIKGSQNIRIYKNDFHCEPGFACGTGGTGGGDHTSIIAGTPVSGYPNQNVEIYDNRFHDTANAVGIIVYYVNGIKIYRNYFENTSGILLSTGSDNIEVSYNIMVNPMDYVIGGIHVGGIYDSPDGTINSKIYNNTVYNNSGDCLNLICSANSRSDIKNNIAYQNKNSSSAFAFRRYSYTGSPTVQNNNWYNALHSNRVSWVGTIYNSSQQQTWRSAGHPGGLFDDPFLNNPSNGNFNLLANSPCIDAGANVGLSKDFAGNSVPQGAGIDIGALEYLESVPSSPQNLHIIQTQ